jgi:succinate dehydrogenase/fumarate reductase flavoprotein subunit
MEDDMQWDKEVDLLVIGGGAGGMGAALVAAIEGLQVMICEKSEQVGGTAATSAGTVWIPGNRQSIAAGFSDTKEKGAEYLENLVGDGRHINLRKTYLDHGPDVIDYFMKNSDVQFVVCGKHPDYLSSVSGAAVSGRALVAKMFDGRVLGREFYRVRAPISEFMVFSGMMVGKDDIPKLLNRFGSVRDFCYSAKLFLRYLADRVRYHRGTRLTMGNALVARLFYSLRKKQVPILFNATIKEVIFADQRVIGAVITHNGKEMRVKANKGIVLATGGFAHNKQLRQEFLPKPIAEYSMSFSGNQGDGIVLGRSLGGVVEPELHGTGAFWTPVSKVTRANGEQALFPHLSLDRAKPGLIAVNAAGKRFVDEGASYHHFVEAMYSSHRQTSTMPTFLICDNNFIRKYGIGHIYPGTTNLIKYIKSGYLVVAPSISELATKIGIAPEILKDTIARHNRFAKTGIDEDFHKGESELSRFNGDANNLPNPCLKAIEGSLYCAMPVWPAEIGGSTGLVTNENASIMDKNGQPILGLYACGNDMASVMRGTYPGPGTTLGPALTFGYLAAMHAKYGDKNMLSCASTES